MKHIAIFASGTGSNALKMIEYFNVRQHSSIRVGLVVSNKKDAPVLEKAQKHDVPTLIIGRANFYNTQAILKDLADYAIDYLVLAGFLWLVPVYLVERFPSKIINIHPALLPKYGGKGMYGMNVHRAVHDARETETGITIHYVNENYDEGQVIFQATCSLELADQPDQIAAKVRALEHQYFAKVVEGAISNE